MSYKKVDWGLYLGKVDDKHCYIVKNYKSGKGEGNFTYAEELVSYHGVSYHGGQGFLDPKKYDESYNFKYSVGRLFGKKSTAKGLSPFDRDLLTDHDLELIYTCFGDSMEYSDMLVKLFIERDIHSFREDSIIRMRNYRRSFGFFLWIIWMFVSMWIIIFLS